MDLRGKVVAVTGAGAGLGRELALALARRGSMLALADLREEPLGETAEMVRRIGARCSTKSFDVADEKPFDAWAGEIVEEQGHVDVLLNNAGMGLPWRRLEDTPLDDLHRIVDVNLWGPVQGTLAFLPHLRRRPEASVVLVTSAASMVASAHQVPYSMSKFALRAFGEGLRMELAGSAVHVVVVLPGGIRGTDFMRHAIERVHGEQGAGNHPPGLPLTVTVRTAAAKIVAGIERDRPRLTVGSDAAAMSAIVRLFPSAYTRLLQPMVARYEQRFSGR